MRGTILPRNRINECHNSIAKGTYLFLTAVCSNLIDVPHRGFDDPTGSSEAAGPGSPSLREQSRQPVHRSERLGGTGRQQRFGTLVHGRVRAEAEHMGL